MFLLVLAGFLVAAIAPGVERVTGRLAGVVLAAAPLTLFAMLLRRAELLEPGGRIEAGGAIRETLHWAPQLGAQLSFRLDGLSLLFALLITGIGGLITLYAGSYLQGHPARGRFFAWLMVFMASMLGLVLADNVISLIVFWELTSISSYFLIGFDHAREAARRAALQALLTTSAGGLAMLAGLVVMAVAGGSWEISELLEQGETLRGHSLYPAMLLLILAGCFTKSAQFPFHYWLPNAMEAPTPVSAYLHSSTMVKAGIYLMARLSPALGGTQLWFAILAIVGGATMVIGAYLAIRQTYLKRILAYSTISALGVLTFLLGLGAAGGEAAAGGAAPVETEIAVYAAQAFTVFLLAHAFYKATLFLIAGSVTHAAGTADVRRLGGLAKAMPLTALAAGLAAFSMAGFPPSFGFLSKELLLEATLKQPSLAILTTAAALLGGILFIVVSGLVAFGPFFGRRQTESPPADASSPTEASPHEVSFPMWIGPLLLGGAGLVCGVLPHGIGEHVVAPAVTAVLGADQLVPIELALWHGFNLPLLLSTIAILTGVGLYVLHPQVSRLLQSGDAAHRFGPEAWYHGGLEGLLAVARWQTGLLQNGSLRAYLRTVLLTAIGLLGWTLLRVDSLPLGIGPWPEKPEEWFYANSYRLAVAGMILLGAVGAVHSGSRLTAIASLGVVGYGVALIYALYGAPDLAMTQFVVETLTVLLFVFVFYYLPNSPRQSTPAHRLRDLLIAVAAGAVMSLLVLVAARVQIDGRISGYFAANSVDVGHGRNVVNVILVDFRALDTLGEITVLAVSALGVLALLKLRPRREKLS
ncbi:putative monovalent cation/H+ antiporter subunit A [Candidatus Laterigemmans baculatus]|uniref:putative monovalent cation/H+ antiporter subunit A n=1 Tax=Candidatus Laterigemmans baculatus TaxID=2770505 RepID=UPI0013DA56EC|nr:putative monovalent cation/H+ antiporter subunit A [Candidatus Laterigemmans baculatus]